MIYLRIAMWLLIFAGGFGSGHWLSDAIKDKQIAALKVEAAQKEEARQKYIAGLEAYYRNLERISQEQTLGVANDYQNRLAELDRNRSITVKRLRDALAKASACDLPSPSSSTGGHHAETDSSGLRGRIAEGLERRIVEPANRQTQQLIACQQYVRILNKEYIR